jgi:hypothetical protein
VLLYIPALTPEKRQVHIASVTKYGRYITDFEYRSLVDLLGSLPNLQELSGFSLPFEQYIAAINGSSLPVITVDGDVHGMISMERLTSQKPDFLRKLRIQQYSINKDYSIEWLNAMTPIHVNHLEVWNLQTGSQFLDHPPTVLSLKSVGVQIDDLNHSQAPIFMEKLLTYIQGPGQSVTRINFDISDLWISYKEVHTFPVIGSLLDIFSSAEAINSDDPTRLDAYTICPATQQSSSHCDWNAWKTISLKIYSCPSDHEFLQAVSEQAFFLETLDISSSGTFELRNQWSCYVLTNVRIIYLCR